MLLAATFGLSQKTQAQTPDYSIECKFEIEQIAAGLCFGMTSPGNYYMWQFNLDKETPRFRPHKWTNGGAACLKEVDMPGVFGLGTEYLLRIEVTNNGTLCTTYLNGTKIDETTGSFPVGRLGFRAAKSEFSDTKESSYWDDFVYTVNGNVSAQENFATGNNLCLRAGKSTTAVCMLRAT